MPSGNLNRLSKENIFAAKEYFLCLIHKQNFEMSFFTGKIKLNTTFFQKVHIRANKHLNYANISSVGGNSPQKTYSVQQARRKSVP